MAEIGIQFEWTRAHSGAPDEAGYEFSHGLIRQIGGRKETYRPQDIRELYLRFAELDGSPASCVSFANRFGLLQSPANSTKLPTERLDLWRRAIRRMKALVSALPTVVRFANSRGTYAEVGRLRVLLVPSSDSIAARPMLIMEPETLLEAMNLQLAQFVVGGGTSFACEQCGTLFERGGTAKRRSDARFCSDRCRVQNHRRNRQ
jgi:hypothetical protein